MSDLNFSGGTDPYPCRVNTGKYVLAQLLDWIHPQQFHRCVSRYRGDHNVSQFPCWSQFLCLVFAQLTSRESLRDIEACLNAQPARLYHLGLRGPVHRTTLADANEQRDWRIYADLAQILLSHARRLYAQDPLGPDLEQSVYALDATIIDLCLSLYPWARFDAARAAVKVHTQLDLRGNLPKTLQNTPGTVQEVTWLDDLIFEPGAIYLMDRGYWDYSRLYAIEQARAWFVIRARRRMCYCRLHSQWVDRSTGLRSDQIISLQGYYAAQDYPDKLRRIRCYDVSDRQALIFLTNHFGLSARTVTELYRWRWQVELFFRWLKQHLRIKVFYGHSGNAVRTQLWIAVCVYALVAIVRKQVKSQRSLFEILQILSVSVFEKTPLAELFALTPPQMENPDQQILLCLQH